MTADSDRSLGLLVVGHGSREPVGIAEFLATTLQVADLAPEWAVEPCFLEFAEPTIAGGLAKLARRGARRIVVAPAMLFSAGHVQRDIPQAVADAVRLYPHVTTVQAEHFGCQEQLLELSALRYAAAIESADFVPPEETVLVMVGRGSHDAQATQEMHDFVAQRRLRTPVGECRSCFAAMAEPRLEATLAELAASSCRRVVVQPHLLFAGVLLDRITASVAQFGLDRPNKQWLVANHLGPAELVARTILAKALPHASAGSGC